MQSLYNNSLKNVEISGFEMNEILEIAKRYVTWKSICNVISRNRVYVTVDDVLDALHSCFALKAFDQFTKVLVKWQKLGYVPFEQSKNQIRDRRGRFTSVCSQEALGIVKSFKSSQDGDDVRDTILILQAMGFSLYEIQVALFAKDEGYVDPLCDWDVYYWASGEPIIMPKTIEDRLGS